MEGSAIPDSRVFLPSKPISELEGKILARILESWPTSSLEIAEFFEGHAASRERKKQLSTKYSYYLQKLVDRQLVFCKRFGNSLVVWPVEVEKYRTIHNILSGRVV